MIVIVIGTGLLSNLLILPSASLVVSSLLENWTLRGVGGKERVGSRQRAGEEPLSV